MSDVLIYVRERICVSISLNQNRRITTSAFPARSHFDRVAVMVVDNAHLKTIKQKASFSGTIA